MSTRAKNNQSLRFLEESARVAAASIKERFQQLSTARRRQVYQFALRLLKDPTLKRKQGIRDGAVGLVVALLPESISVLRKLLGDRSSPLWYEVQFTIFCTLDGRVLQPEERASVLQLAYEYLLTINSNAGFAAWKAGDTLGHEWRSPETVRMLADLLVSAKYVPGRKAAVHGIEHALKNASPEEAKELREVLQTAARKDRSIEVRRDAQLALRGGRIGHGGWPTQLHQTVSSHNTECSDAVGWATRRRSLEYAVSIRL